MGVKPIHAACYYMTSASLPEALMKTWSSHPGSNRNLGIRSAAPCPLDDGRMVRVRGVEPRSERSWRSILSPERYPHKHLAGRSGVEPETSAFRAQRAARLRQRPIGRGWATRTPEASFKDWRLTANRTPCEPLRQFAAPITPLRLLAIPAAVARWSGGRELNPYLRSHNPPSFPLDDLRLERPKPASKTGGLPLPDPPVNLCGSSRTQLLRCDCLPSPPQSN